MEGRGRGGEGRVVLWSWDFKEYTITLRHLVGAYNIFSLCAYLFQIPLEII